MDHTIWCIPTIGVMRKDFLLNILDHTDTLLSPMLHALFICKSNMHSSTMWDLVRVVTKIARQGELMAKPNGGPNELRPISNRIGPRK